MSQYGLKRSEVESHHPIWHTSNINVMSTAAVQAQPETLIRHLLEGTSSKIGEEFFEALVHAAAQALDVAGVWVTEYLPDERVLKSLSFWLNGDYIKHFEYK